MHDQQDTDSQGDLSAERHYTPQEVAELWVVSIKTVQRTFRGQPGVIAFGNDDTRWGRKHKTIRIPATVLARGHHELRSKL